MKIFTSVVILKTVLDYCQLTVMTWTKEVQKCVYIWQNIKETSYKMCYPYAVMPIYNNIKPSFS